MNLEEENKTPEIETDNIFDEISSGFETDVNESEDGKEELPPEIRKMEIAVKALLGTVIAFSVVIVLMWAYVWFQKSDLTETFLPPVVCSVFSGDANVDNSMGCSSVTALQKNYSQKLSEEKFNILKETLRLIPDVYEVEDFLNSTEVVFLLDKSDNKVRPLGILEAFDDVKNEFSSIGKSDIECGNITINKDEELSAECIVYSYDWQTDINGTSQSLAALFQQEFEKSSKFSLLEKQRKFSSTPVHDKPLVSRKTEIRLRLKYEGGDSINF